MSRKNLNKIWLSSIVAVFLFVGSFSLTSAEEKEEAEEKAPVKVEYQAGVIADSDFDGLTDEGEIQIYKTDPNNQDSDSDGFYDGSEILRGTNPLSITDPLDFQLADQIQQDIMLETPWAWYVTRSAGLIGFVFLWLSILLGLAIRNNLLRKLVEPIYSFGFHCFLGSSALFWGFIHALSLLFHGEFALSWREVYIPFYSKTNLVDTDYLALGIIAFYAMVILVVTSYAKNFISHKLWRAFHFLNPLVFIFTVLHGYFIGTDMQNEWIRNIFVGASVFLAAIYFSNLFFAVWNNWRNKPEEKKDENQN